MEEETKMQELSFHVNTAPAVIDANFDELEAALKVKLSDYTTLVVSDETEGECRKAKAELVKARRMIEAAGSAEKKKLEEPVKAFDKRCKGLVVLIKDAEKYLDSGLSVYDEKVREAKREFARQQISAAVSEFGLRSPFAEELTVLPEYGNKTISKKAITESVRQRAGEILSRQQAYDRDLQRIEDAVNTENGSLSVKLSADRYTADFSSGRLSAEDALFRIHADAANIRAQEEAMRIRAAREAEMRAAREAEAKAAEEAARAKEAAMAGQQEDALVPPSSPADETEPVPIPPEVPAPDLTCGPSEIDDISMIEIPEEAEPVYEAYTIIRGTKAQMAALGRFFKENGIVTETKQYRRIS